MIIRPDKIPDPPEPDFKRLAESWGLDAVKLMQRHDDRARYSAELAMKFARKGRLIDLPVEESR